MSGWLERWSSARRAVRRTAAAVAVAALAVTGAVTAPSAVAATSPPGWLSTRGASIVTSAGTPYTIKAVAWFGMETSNCAPHGLWSISLDEGLRAIAGMGFNTIRLPFSNECLAAASSNSINSSVNADLVALSPLKLMDTVIARAKTYGLSVILDRHRPDSAAQSELWYTGAYSEKRWIDDWKMLAGRYKNEPAVIGVDLHNEPHGAACWNCGDPARDWRAAATRAGDAVLSVNPKLLIVVEGVERQNDGSSTWWGGGLRDAGSAPVKLSVADRVVYSPHDYPASVYQQPWFSAPTYPANLEAVWDANWGYLVRKNIAPVLLGEFGSKLETDGDKKWMSTLVAYLAKTKISYAYWSFNPNSGDTGGLVADDWRTLQKAKLAALQPILTPVAVPTPKPTAGATATPKPTATPSPTRSPSPAATPQPTATPSPKPTTSPKPTASPTPSASPSASPRPSASSTPTPATSPKPTTSPASSPSVTWIPQSAWGEGYVAELSVTAGAQVKSWSVSFEAPGTTAVTNAWGMACTVGGTTVTCTGSAWAATLAPGQTVRVGLQAAATKAPAAPTLRVSAS